MSNKWSVLAATACALGLAIPLSAANAANKTARSSWPAETLSARIAMVDPAQHLVVLETPDQVTYDLIVTAKTRIKTGSQNLTLQELSQDKDKSASVNFTPERRGDIAKSIQMGG